MQFPLTPWDLSLLLAVTSIILLATAELTSPYNQQTNLLLNHQRLEKTALTTGTLFLITVAIHIYTIITTT